MNRVNPYISATYFRIGQSCIAAAVVSTFAINPISNYDPISVVKMLPLTLFVFFGAGLFFSNKGLLLNLISEHKLIVGLIASFWIFMISSIFGSGASFLQQFWGTFGRNTGFLTYFSLSLLFLIFVSVSNPYNVRNVRTALLFSSIPMTIYACLQYAKRDPVTWSEQAVFGTLGNINFLSAFFGMTSVVIFSIVLESQKWIVRVSLLFLITVDFFLIYSTGSIQGPIILIIGIYVLLLCWFVMSGVRKFLVFLYVTIGLLLGSCGALALTDKGPLKDIIYQPTILFRADYMHAGWEMTLSHPFFGVGMDSYGDWYREVRGEISTLRTGPDRVSNAAHNVFLDISSNGGVPLGIVYVSVVIVTFYSAIKALRNLRLISKNDLLFAGLFATWVAYQIQSAISINQIGIAVWGWLLSAAVYSYAKFLTSEVLTGSFDTSKKPKPSDGSMRRRTSSNSSLNLLPAKSLLFGVSLGVFGLILALPPVVADASYRQAVTRGSYDEMKNSIERMGATQWHMELVLDAALRSNNQSEVFAISQKLTEKYPRSFFGWQIRATFPESRSQALLKLKALDPFNPTIPNG